MEENEIYINKKKKEFFLSIYVDYIYEEEME